MLKRTNIRLTVLFGILIALNLCILEAQGIKCYTCNKCPDPKNEVDCRPNEIHCYFAEANTGDKNRGCSTAADKAGDESRGVKCDDFGSAGFKRCYCDEDLCNGSGTAKGRYHIFVAIFLYATVYQGKMIN